MSSRDVVFCEDKYGKPFLKELTTLLKNKKILVNSLGIDTAKFHGACNVKLERQLKAKSTNPPHRIVILVDSDGKQNKTSLTKRVQRHIPASMGGITSIIVFDYEIEDWLCIGLGISLDERSAHIMKRRFGYEKYMLPSYVQKLDVEKLMQFHTFSDFVNSL